MTSNTIDDCMSDENQIKRAPLRPEADYVRIFGWQTQETKSVENPSSKQTARLAQYFRIKCAAGYGSMRAHSPKPHILK